MNINHELYAHIARKHGEMASLLAKIRDMQSDIAALDAQTMENVRVTVLTVGAPQFSMMLPVATLREIVEADLDAHTRKLLAVASIPFDWMNAVAVELPATNGGNDHV
jgi:hypothetical protein